MRIFLILLITIFGSLFSSVLFAQEQAVLDHRCLGASANTCYVLIDGPITNGLTQRVIELEAEATRLYLNSPGGDLGEALKLGRYMRTTGWRVSLGEKRPDQLNEDGSKSIFDSGFPSGGVCNSACAYAFMGGSSRHLRPTDKIGIHRFWASRGDIDGDSAQIISGKLINYMIEMDIDPRVYKIAALTNPQDMYFLSSEETAEYNIVSDFSYKELNLEPYRNGIIAWTKPRKEKEGGGLSQVTFLCKQGRAEIFFQISRSPDMERIQEHDFEVEIDGNQMPVSSERLSVRPDGDDAYLTVPLDAKQTQAFLGAKEVSFFGRWGFDHGSGVGVTLQFSMLDRQKLEIAFTQCAG